MRRILSLSLAFLFTVVPSTMAAEIWSDVLYTEQTSTQSPSSSAKIFYKTYDEVKALGCEDAKFSLGEGWYCKDGIAQNQTSVTTTSNTSVWSEPETTEQWIEAETTELWTEAETTNQEELGESLSFTVDPVIENGVIYAPVEEIAGYLGLVTLPLDDPKGIAVLKGEKEILYFFPGLNKYVQFNIQTEKMDSFTLPKAVQEKGNLTIVPIDIIIKFAGGSMNYNAKAKKVTVNDTYDFHVTAESAESYTKQWTEPQYTEQWTEPQYTEQWADTPRSTSHWSEEATLPSENSWDVPAATGGIFVFKTNPVNENGRFLVPLRELFEMLGVSVEWDEKTRTISAVKETRTIKFTIGMQQAFVNGQVKSLDVPGKIIKGKTMVPLRFISEALGEKVNYDASKMEITVGKDRILLPSPNTQTQTSPSSTPSNSNVPYGGMTDQQWETQKILDRYFNNSFNMTGTYRPSYQWNSGY
ncbi:copper amine oxidase N-terminal domain-containing protein [Ammoniphilus resinae]|uniref:Copper amine oxidase-like N-terminal domain-containing protein n=1 Tax=Ammoniphilus resinae TaxID=861532 RepID=A0ABS4GT91_9BACL|nr:stalk domain-containing protein [Ammoniphilus resinae]MBP1933495.1 hypothetical protein [Ammoniphilus resinae]